jgi:drug/metabolite transporter (DMT)-like permease
MGGSAPQTRSTARLLPLHDDFTLRDSGGAFVGIKLSTIDLPPLGSGAIRFCLVSLVLLAWARYQHIPLLIERAKLRALTIPTLCSCYTNLVVYIGTMRTTSGRATVFFYTQPIFLAFGPYFCQATA